MYGVTVEMIRRDPTTPAQESNLLTAYQIRLALLRFLYVLLSSCSQFNNHTAGMHSLGVVFVDVVIGLFFVGLAGSAIVILISFVEDFKELFGPDEPEVEPARSHQSAPPITTGASFAAPKSSAKQFAPGAESRLGSQ
jgi:hypothetical protein